MTQSKTVTIQGGRIFYLETGPPDSGAILFLHGANFNAQTWEKLGTLTLLADKQYRAVAVDLPGFGQSEQVSTRPPEFLLELIESLNLDRPILVSPSMSGRYSLALVANQPQKLTGFIPVAPVGIPYLEKQLSGVKLPTLAIWGSDDHIVPPEQADLLCRLMPEAEKAILVAAGHACYLRATAEFHRYLIAFVERCYG